MACQDLLVIKMTIGLSKSSTETSATKNRLNAWERSGPSLGWDTSYQDVTCSRTKWNYPSGVSNSKRWHVTRMPSRPTLCGLLRLVPILRVRAQSLLWRACRFNLSWHVYALKSPRKCTESQLQTSRIPFQILRVTTSNVDYECWAYWPTYFRFSSRVMAFATPRHCGCFCSWLNVQLLIRLRLPEFLGKRSPSDLPHRQPYRVVDEFFGCILLCVSPRIPNFTRQERLQRLRQ